MVVLLLRYGGNPELLDAEGKPCHAAIAFRLGEGNQRTHSLNTSSVL